MELYAGMVENMDFHVGRLIDYLKKIGEYDNTIFIVFGDNGAEGTDLFKMIAGTPGTRDFLFASIQWSQTHPECLGRPAFLRRLRPDVGPGFDDALQPVQRLHAPKAASATRLIVSGPIVKRPQGSINRGVMHVADIMPTLLEVAGASYPKTVNGQEPPPLIGKSWVKLLAGEEESPRSGQDYLAWEIFGNRAVRQGDWKLRWQYKPYGTEQWELFNLAEDVAERHDLAAAATRQGQGAAGALGRLCPRQQRDPAQPRVVGRAWRRSCRIGIRWKTGYPPLIYKRQFIPPTNMLADPKP